MNGERAKNYGNIYTGAKVQNRMHTKSNRIVLTNTSTATVMGIHV